MLTTLLFMSYCFRRRLTWLLLNNRTGLTIQCHAKFFIYLTYPLDDSSCVFILQWEEVLDIITLIVDHAILGGQGSTYKYSIHTLVNIEVNTVLQH